MADKKEEKIIGKCEWCEEELKDGYAMQDGVICEGCHDDSFECHDCGDTYAFRDNERFIEDRGYSVCESCYENNGYFCCNGCGDYLSERVYRDDGYCEGCDTEEDEVERNTTGIHYRKIDLHTKDFKSEENGEFITSKRTFGVELEMVSKETEHLAELSHSLDGRIGVENDGSIQGGYGIEIQTPILKGKKGEDSLIQIVETAKKCRLGVNKTCGTHVHLGAEDFVPELQEEYIVSPSESIPDSATVRGMILWRDNKILTDVAETLGGGRLYKINGVGYKNSYEDILTPLVGTNGELQNKELFGANAEVMEGAMQGIVDSFGRGIHQGYMGCEGLPDETLFMLFNSHNSIERTKATMRYAGEKGESVYIIYSKRVAKNSDIVKLKTLLAFYTVFDDVILAMISESRRGNMYCKPIKSAYSLLEVLDVNSLDGFDKLWYKRNGTRGTNGGRDRDTIKERKEDGHDSSRYQGVNFHSMLGKNKTLEIRYHSGTLDSKKILSWVALHQAIMDRVASGKISLEDIEKSSMRIKFESKLKDFFSLLDLEEKLRTYVVGRINTYNK